MLHWPRDHFALPAPQPCPVCNMKDARGVMGPIQSMIFSPFCASEHFPNCSCEPAKMPKISTLCVLSLCLEDLHRHACAHSSATRVCPERTCPQSPEHCLSASVMYWLICMVEEDWLESISLTSSLPKVMFLSTKLLILPF